MQPLCRFRFVKVIEVDRAFLSSFSFSVSGRHFNWICEERFKKCCFSFLSRFSVVRDTHEMLAVQIGFCLIHVYTEEVSGTVN